MPTKTVTTAPTRMPRDSPAYTAEKLSAAVPGPYWTASRKRWLTVLIIGSVLFVITTALVVSGASDSAEFALFHSLNRTTGPSWLAPQVAKPLSNAVWGMVALSIAALLVPAWRRRAWRLCVATGGTYVGVALIEHLVGRERPLHLIHGAVLRAMQDGYGYPSGHVAVISVLLVMTWVTVNWYARAAFVVLIAAEAWSRIYLGMHAPLDTVAGLSIGVCAAATLHVLPPRILELFWLKPRSRPAKSAPVSKP